MKLKKILVLVGVSVCGAVLLSGCSCSETMDNVLGHAEKVVESEVSTDKNAKKVDAKIEKPVFGVNLEGSVKYAIGMEATPLVAEATVTDGGTITYQWYTNSANSNGGGEPIDGQTAASCIPDTSELGTCYYYVVATNNQGNSVSKVASATYEVKIVPEGTWVDEAGRKRYQLYDGSYATGVWKDIDGQRYAFDETGYMRSGWFKETDGTWYYLNPDGTLARDIEVDGYQVDSEGKSEAKRQAEEAAAQAAAAKAAAEAEAAAQAAAAQAAAQTTQP